MPKVKKISSVSEDATTPAEVVNEETIVVPADESDCVVISHPDLKGYFIRTRESAEKSLKRNKGYVLEQISISDAIEYNRNNEIAGRSTGKEGDPDCGCP